MSLDRIEAALARIEAAASTLAAPVPAHVDTHTANTAEVEDLERRHAALKTSVEHTLARLDGLIEEQSIDSRIVESKP